MKALHRGVSLGIGLCAWAVAQLAMAAPDRLLDDVRDAVPDQPGAFSLSWAHLGMDLEGALSGQRTAHDFFKLRYTFNPKVSTTLRYARHDLAGGFGLLSPVLDNKDFGEAYEIDLHMNLMNVPAVAADPANNVAYAAGSSFGIGVSGTQYQLDAGAVGQDQTLLKAYLVYTTDLSEELRAHTVFSSARLSGDEQSGSLNRVGAGLDYALITGERPLVLMANGIIDIYNFRQPSFNTSRVSRFDVGLRYRLAEDWYASLGWVTANDSENDKSGSGIFASINFVDEPPPPCPPAPPEPPEPPPAESAETPPQAAAEPAAGVADSGQAAPPPLMDVEAPADDAKTTASSAPDATLLTDVLGVMDGPDEDTAGAENDTEAVPAPSDEAEDTDESGDIDASADVDEGIAVPEFPAEPPQHTADGAVMVRPPVAEAEIPQPTAADATFVRPDLDSAAEESAAEATADGLIAAAPTAVFRLAPEEDQAAEPAP